MVSGMPRVTITDVAREAGVSVATVSKVLNGRDGVAASTLLRVQGVIARLGYESSLVATSLRSRRTNVIGCLVADFEPFSAEILKGVGTALHGSDLELLAYSARRADGSEWENRSLRRLSGTLIDGAILVTPTVLAAPVDIPVVVIDPHTGPEGTPAVESDSLEGALTATRHLLDLGHTRIGHIGGYPEQRTPWATEVCRARGYRDAMRAAGLPDDPDLLAYGRFERDGGRRAAVELLERVGDLTAIVADSDEMAFGALEVLRERGVTVPGRVSVVGVDGHELGDLIGLTTVAQDAVALGGAAAGLMLEMITGAPVDRDVVFPVELVRRASTRRH